MRHEKPGSEEKIISKENNDRKNKNNYNLNGNRIEPKDKILAFSEDYGVQLKVPAVSVILSGLFPGLGQVYNGDSLLKGLLIFFGAAFGSFVFLIPGLIVWIYGMYDAWKRASGINSGIYDYKPVKTGDLILMVMIPLILMVILMALSIYTIMQLAEIPRELNPYLR